MDFLPVETASAFTVVTVLTVWALAPLRTFRRNRLVSARAVEPERLATVIELPPRAGAPRQVA